MPPGDRLDAAPAMSAATRALLARVRLMVPPLRSTFHKGQLGRVGVIGGSEDYTGAPYFSAMASARLGCDMSHVICTPAAAAVIKTYSPNLMVHPLMRQQQPSADNDDGVSPARTVDIDAQADAISRRIGAELLPRLHVLVVGPGLGRDPLMQATVARVVALARARNMPVVVDADALQLVQRDPGLVRGYRLAVLTPNVVEFGRLKKALLADDVAEAKGGPPSTPQRLAGALASALQGVTIVQKGGDDIVATARPDDGDVDSSRYGPYVCDLPGGRKRSGGQGDTLTGSIATFLAWRKAYLDGLWDSGGSSPERLGEWESVLLAAFGGSAITREASRLAFAKKGRSLQASDLTDEIHTAFQNLFGEEEDEEGDASKL